LSPPDPAENQEPDQQDDRQYRDVRSWNTMPLRGEQFGRQGLAGQC
jgi:hypothetical protein